MALPCRTALAFPHQSQRVTKQRTVEVEKIMRSTKLDSQRSASLNEQHGHIIQIQTLSLCTAVQKTHTAFLVFLHFLSDALGLPPSLLLSMLPAVSFFTTLSPRPLQYSTSL